MPPLSVYQNSLLSGRFRLHGGHHGGPSGRRPSAREAFRCEFREVVVCPQQSSLSSWLVARWSPPAPPPRRTAPAPVRRTSSPSGTPISPVRPVVGPAVPTTPRHRRTR